MRISFCLSLYHNVEYKNLGHKCNCRRDKKCIFFIYLFFLSITIDMPTDDGTVNFKI